ncbi:MAG: TIGR00725 family protein [Thermomicrobiales bacterium]
MSAHRPRPIQIAVSAPGDGDPATMALAEGVGRAIARRGCVLVCGGLGGGMRAACAGAKAEGGTTIGIIPGYDAVSANEHVDHVILTGLGQARNTLVAASGDAMVAVGGGLGTLSEIALALRLNRPVVALSGWAAMLATPEAREMLADVPGRLSIAETPDDAVREAVRMVVGS